MKARIARAGLALLRIMNVLGVSIEDGLAARLYTRLRWAAATTVEEVLKLRVDLARKMGAKVGENCRFYSLNMFSEPYLIDIGDNVIVSGEVKFITHDGSIFLFRSEMPDICGNYGRIVIGNNCFIGMGAIIMPNVRIGDNCIVGAGAVVTRSCGDDCVLMGNPARSVMHLSMYRRMKLNTPHTIASERSRAYSFPADIPAAELRDLLADLPSPPVARSQSAGQSAE